MKFRRGGQVVHQRTVAIDLLGTTLDINIAKDLGCTTTQEVFVEVAFTEEVTKKVTISNTQLTVNKFLYTVVDAGDLLNFVLNTPLSFKLSVRKYDGTSVKKTKFKFFIFILI